MVGFPFNGKFILLFNFSLSELVNESKVDSEIELKSEL